MSGNKGKDGEMQTIRLITYIGESEEGIDLTRHTTTNTADMGADLIITHRDNYLSKMAQIADGVPQPNAAQPSSSNIARSRIDVKTTDKKINKSIVEKFVGDVCKHPTCQGHILWGGENLTGPAKKVFSQDREAFGKDGITLMYINNSGAQKLKKHYRQLIEDKTNDT